MKKCSKCKVHPVEDVFSFVKSGEGVWSVAVRYKCPVCGKCSKSFSANLSNTIAWAMAESDWENFQ